MELYDKIKQLRKERGLTLEQVGTAVGVGKSTVRKWENGDIANMRRDKIAKLAAILNTSPSFLMGWEDEEEQTQIPPGFIPPPRMVKVPLVGSIACGTPIEALENLEGYVDVPDNIRCDFALRCHGDSMVDAKIQDGDVVYIRKQPDVENGEIAAVRIGNEATLKRVYKDTDSIILVPANAAHMPKTYIGEEVNQITIEGKMIGFTHWVG